MEAPKAKTVYSASMKSFHGIDLRNSPSNVDLSRSPMCVNMIRDTIGTNRKRRGYETIGTLDGRVNGFHTLNTPTGKSHLVHAGTKLYTFTPKNDEFLEVYAAANDHFSMSRQVNSKLYILDGADILVFDGETVKSVSAVAYVPTTMIGKDHSGGGTSLEPLNLLTPFRTERFMGDATNLTFQMGTAELDADPVEIKALNEAGTFDTLEEGTDFTVNRTLGTFILKEAKKTPVTGVDNLYVTYAKTVAGYADRVKKCDICTLYGMNGQRDRLFVSGNPEFPNYDWYCKSNDPTYFGDIWYSVMGQDDSSVVGYSVLNGQLLTFKDGAANDSNIILRTGIFDENTSQNTFKTVGNYEAAGALGKHTFASLKNEPMYLTTEKSIHAITPSDVLGERSSQERSYYISEALAGEEGLEESYGIKYKDFYILATGDKAYILDTAQAAYERNTPYSTRQYECYLWTGINARVLHVIDDDLYFGTTGGKVKRFFGSELGEQSGGYTDDGILTEKTVDVDGVKITTKESFPCYWETAEIYTGGSDHAELKKTFKHLVVALNAFAHTGCRVWAKINGLWELIFDYDSSANFFSWDDIDFEDFTFRTDATPTLIGGKFKAKKLLHIQFRFENSKPQPFSILFAKTKYTVGNEYRK
ncbi:MAG: hypothetical protein IJB73_04185 [Firmicutes bacterium]|nr:hypothetical protein [Bacillota bacterium]